MVGFRVTVSVLVLAALSVAAGDISGKKSPLAWVLIARGEDPPANVIYGGFESHPEGVNGGPYNPLYVGRVWGDSAIIPAYVTKYGNKHQAFAALWGATYTNVETYEVAVAPPSAVRWVPAALGAVPEGAVPSGVTAGGRPLYVCRVLDTSLGQPEAQGTHQFMMTAGVLETESKLCHCEFYGPRVYSTYEVLVVIGD